MIKEKKKSNANLISVLKCEIINHDVNNNLKRDYLVSSTILGLIGLICTAAAKWLCQPLYYLITNPQS